jgi:uncharacterized membrane protein YeaQ/YmgE (transglycosylase-associated protein family)
VLASPKLGTAPAAAITGILDYPRLTERGQHGDQGFIWTIIVGLIVGAIARWIMPGVQSMGWIMTSDPGIVGSIVGGFVSSLIWKSPDGKFHPAGWILSILGALVVLWAYMQFVNK